MDLAESVRAFVGAVDVARVAEGHQSRVYELLLADGERVAAKLIDAALVDGDIVATRVGVVARLAAIDARVCRPLPVGGSLVNALIDDRGRPAWLICSAFAAGVPPDPTDERDAELMGSTLAGLHRSLAGVDAAGLPIVAGLEPDPAKDAEPFQLLHGDFNTGNLRREGSMVHVFDFEDCGRGPVAYDIANALYMVLFDATLDAAPQRYRDFEAPFLAGYRAEAGKDIDRTVVEGFIDRRVAAVAGWLDDLSTAPIGIRTATPAWHGVLRSFVDGYRRNKR